MRRTTKTAAAAPQRSVRAGRGGAVSGWAVWRVGAGALRSPLGGRERRGCCPVVCGLAAPGTCRERVGGGRHAETREGEAP